MTRSEAQTLEQFFTFRKTLFTPDEREAAEQIIKEQQQKDPWKLAGYYSHSEQLQALKSILNTVSKQDQPATKTKGFKLLTSLKKRIQDYIYTGIAQSDNQPSLFGPDPQNNKAIKSNLLF